MSDICPNCGTEFKHVGKHWARSSDCEYPQLTQHQKDIITGLLMGDGCLNKQNDRNPRLQSRMISQNYLKYVDKQMGVLGNGVRKCMTAEESANQTRERGFSKNAQSEDYSDMYRWESRTHPDLSEFSDWYSSGKKVWPNNIELTPTVLKHWYCGDGYWNNNSGHNFISISISNESDNTEKVDKIFSSANLPQPNNYCLYERNTGGVMCKAQFTVEQSKKLWRYMGEPLPDFKYKWPDVYK